MSASPPHPPQQPAAAAGATIPAAAANTVPMPAPPAVAAARSPHQEEAHHHQHHAGCDHGHSHAAQTAPSTAVAPAPAAAAPSLPRVCGYCGRGGAISRCSKCLSTYYCTQQCQAGDWKRHKPSCVPAGRGFPPNSTFIVPPPATRSSVAAANSSSLLAPKEAATQANHSHSHSHGGGAGASGHSHGGHSHAAHHVHTCSSPTCPHHGPANKAQAATRSAAVAAASAANAVAAATAVTAPITHSVTGVTLPTGSPVLHSQTSYSPVPPSNVSASSRHIYVPPCRPTLRPSCLSFPSSHAHGPPLSCIHGFHTNLLFSPDPVRILYADLGDPRHVLQSLCDLHGKMKAWRKKKSAAAGLDADKNHPSRRKASELPLPTPPSLASAKNGNPNIGIEFHLNDANPHVLARSILFLVSAYMSSAVMNQEMAAATAASFGIQLHANSVHSHPPPAAGATTTAAAPSPFCLSSYAHWTPSDHWAFLSSLYGCYQLPVQFLRRIRETLELLVRLTGASTVAMERASGTNDTTAAPFTITSHEASLFSQHPYTFFLHLPSVTLSFMLPIWRAWEATCARALAAAASSADKGASYRFPPITPLFTEADVRAAHPTDAPLQDVLNTFYSRGCVSLEPRHFAPAHALRTTAEWTAVALEGQLERTRIAATTAEVKDDTATTTAASSRRPHVPLPEMLPPSLEEYAQIDSFLLNPTIMPLNHSGAQFSSASSIMPVASPAPSASSQRDLVEVDARSIMDELSTKWLFAREPFSMLLPKLTTTPATAKKAGEKVAASDDRGGGVISAVMELMSKMSHALFWVVGFQQSAALAHPPKHNKVPYVRLYFYSHDLYFHLHTYDFLYDRILVYHLEDWCGMQSLALVARHRMKDSDSLLECTMNFPSCLTGGEDSNGAATLPDLDQFCRLALNANLKLLRNIFGWELQVYTYPSSGVGRPLTTLRFTVCDFNLDLSAPPGQTSDGFHVINDWLMAAIQPILLHDEAGGADSLPLDEVRTLQLTTPRSICNLRPFCLLIGLLIKQGHLDQAFSRKHMVHLFATLLAPRSPLQMDHLFTSLITHIGLLKAELLPLMYLVLTPLEDTLPEVIGHNTLFFKGLWQLEMVSMKFEALLPAFHAQQAASLAALEACSSASTDLAHANSTTSKAFDATCRLCAVAGPNHAHHASHAPMIGTAPPREPLLSLLFVTDPRSCPSPVSSFSATTTAGSNPASPSSPASATSPSPSASPPSPSSPLAWVQYREGAMLRWLRETGRGAQLLDVAEIDWSNGIVKAWMNRTYVNYVRKCSSFAQVCVVDFEQMRVVAPPRSVVHLKTVRSMNIR